MSIYYKSTQVDGGHKLMYGSKEVQKLMLKDKLIYQNVLPKGTVLLENYSASAGNHTIDLPMVSYGWANVNRQIAIIWKDYSEGYVYTSKEELLTGKEVYRYNRRLALTFSRTNSSQLLIKSEDTSYLIEKIYLV